MQVLATLLLGIYPAAMNYVELAGRKPAHTFLDFSTAFVLTALPCALALSGSGPHSDFMCGFKRSLSLILMLSACGPWKPRIVRR